MILHPKGNLMFLNTFQIKFWRQNDFYSLWEAWKYNCWAKKRKNSVSWLVFCVFSPNHSDFLPLRYCKNHFDTQFCLKRVQKHRNTLWIQYHDLRTCSWALVWGETGKNMWPRATFQIFSPFLKGGCSGNRLWPENTKHRNKAMFWSNFLQKLLFNFLKIVQKQIFELFWNQILRKKYRFSF